ncbi:MAG: DUF1844 domain-containing protein [Desulfobulbaceae bacterium]|nr:DUF1844 domain-containing protein [Desulfobulbaceae bacterium]MCK5545382.1 DUF1844 domain-containing protein [Desulfobulbaceae bacterium]
MSDEEKTNGSGGKCSLPEVTFTSFVMSLNTSTLFHLGEIGEPGTGKKNKDPVLAKYSIDTLNMLHEKTKGNLTEDEDEMLQNILYDLKMRYVNAGDKTGS